MKEKVIMKKSTKTDMLFLALLLVLVLIVRFAPAIV